MFKRCFLKRELDSLSVQTSESEVSPEPGVRGQARGAILNIVAGDSDCRASASFRVCSPSVLIVEPVWGVLGASLPSAPCRSRTHGSCPCSSREISSGLKTRNPAVEVANKDTKLAWLGMQPRAQRPWLPGVKGWGLRGHRTASEGGTQASPSAQSSC